MTSDYLTFEEVATSKIEKQRRLRDSGEVSMQEPWKQATSMTAYRMVTLRALCHQHAHETAVRAGGEDAKCVPQAFFHNLKAGVAAKGARCDRLVEIHSLTQ